MIQRIKSLISGKNTVTAAATILVATTFLSNVLGLLRDRFFAQKIPTDLLDTYFAAFRLPDLIFNLLILGTVSAAFIPLFLAERRKSERHAWRLVNRTITLAVGGLVALAGLLWLLMPLLTPLLVPDFSPHKQELTLQLTRILLIQPIFFGLSYLFSGILNAMKRFFVYALAPLVYTLSIIAATLLLADRFGVYALATGVVAGSLLHMLIQGLAARSVGWRWQFDFRPNDPVIRKLIRLMIPRSIGLGAMQLMLLVFTNIASSLGSGSVAIYSFADNIQTMPTAVFGLAFITALYPTLSEAATQRDDRAYAELLWRGIRYLLVVLVPAGIGLILLRSEIVRLILGTGYFGWEATIATHQTLALFAVSLAFQAIAALLARAFYARHDTLTPTIHQVLGFALSITLAYAFAPVTGLALGVPGLALAFSLGSALTMALLYAKLRVVVPALTTGERALWSLLGDLAIGSIALVASVQLVKFGVASVVDLNHFWEVFLRASLAIAAGAAAYWIVMMHLGVQELSLITEILRRKFWHGALRSAEEAERDSG